jgi:hypothetical protein
MSQLFSGSRAACGGHAYDFVPFCVSPSPATLADGPNIVSWSARPIPWGSSREGRAQRAAAAAASARERSALTAYFIAAATL